MAFGFPEGGASRCSRIISSKAPPPGSRSGRTFAAKSGPGRCVSLSNRSDSWRASKPRHGSFPRRRARSPADSQTSTFRQRRRRAGWPAAALAEQDTVSGARRCTERRETLRARPDPLRRHTPRQIGRSVPEHRQRGRPPRWPGAPVPGAARRAFYCGGCPWAPSAKAGSGSPERVSHAPSNPHESSHGRRGGERRKKKAPEKKRVREEKGPKKAPLNMKR